MKVLRQNWVLLKGGQLTSLSKDREQLQETIEELAPRSDPEDESDFLNYNEAATPDDDSEELDIPDDSIFAEMIKRRTVFLHDDEMDIVYDNLPEE